ncbi:MAG: hypothetical protein V1850_06525 [Candidatus Bathyarchaeota archaeon]
MSYYELWNVLSNWKREFTTKEFSSVFASPDPNKVLHDMTEKGLLEKAGWGKYKVNSPQEYLSKRIDVPKGYELLKKAGLEYALTGSDAVFIWTKGGYQVDRFFGFYPIHLKVKKSDLARWKKFLSSKRQKCHVEGQPLQETFFGLFYVLYPKEGFDAEEIEGYRVDSLKETVEFCRKKIYSYEPALEMLDEMYNLGLRIEYREEKTNV